MLLHKGGQISNVQLITGTGSAEICHTYIIAVSTYSKINAGILKKKDKKENKKWRGVVRGRFVCWCFFFIIIKLCDILKSWFRIWVVCTMFGQAYGLGHYVLQTPFLV